MKKHALTLVLLFWAFLGFSQYGYYYDYEYSWNEGTKSTQDMLKFKNQIKSNNVSKRTITYENVYAKKPIEITTETEFDNNGNALTYSNFNKKNKLTSKIEYNYDSKNRTTKTTIFDKKLKMKYSTEYIYIDGNMMPDIISKNSKGEIRWKSEYTYSNGNIMQYKLYEKGKLSKRYEYEYYDSTNLKTIKIYNSKGKITKVWSYECKKDGEVIHKSKDTTRVCKLTDYDNQGYKTVSYNTTDEKGKTSRYVSKYLNDTVLVSTKSYNSKDILTYEFSTSTQNDTTTNITKYYNKGKLRTESVRKLNKDNNFISSRYTRKGILKKSAQYVYNEKGLLIEDQRFDKDSKIILRYIYSYKYF